MLRTPLYNQHRSLGGKMVEFFGYEMPLQYKSIMAEHNSVRNSVGIFDISHMGEIFVGGPGAEAFLNYVTTNNVASIGEGGVQYNLFTNEQGGVIDDILVYRLPTGYYLVVNAANKDKDYQWLLKYAPKDVSIKDLSSETALISVQGPLSSKVMEKVFGPSISKLKYYRFIDLDYKNSQIRISRTGYTGEDGFEIYHPPSLAAIIWENLLAKGAPYQIQPVGLGARDTLRLEMRMHLYGNELTESITPLEAGLERVVDFNKGDFLGKTALLEKKDKGLTQKLVGFQLLGKGISRQGYPIFVGDEQIGYVTSGSLSPTSGKSIGLAYVSREYARVGQKISIQIRKQPALAEIIKGRFVQVKSKK